jgi:hypothetical protein
MCSAHAKRRWQKLNSAVATGATTLPAQLTPVLQLEQHLELSTQALASAQIQRQLVSLDSVPFLPTLVSALTLHSLVVMGPVATRMESL